jgi:outer membrane protein OmpA-like peptidoglycan-associated protein
MPSVPEPGCPPLRRGGKSVPEGVFRRVTCITSVPLNRSYGADIKALSRPNFAGVMRGYTMSRLKFSGLKAITICAALSMTAGLALAADGNVSASQILNALQPKPVTRGLSTEQLADSAAKAKEASFVQGLRNRQTRSLSLSEREQIADIATTKPNIDLEINFDYNSASISKASMPSVKALGEALSDTKLKGSTFMVAGHTDGIGGDTYNQELSERRAETIKRYLVEKFGLATGDLVTVGYGKTKLKDTANPADPINRRVQVVNLEAKTASK